MENPTYEDFVNDPEAVMDEVRRKARRARALAVRRYLLKPLARFCGNLLAVRGIKLYLDPRSA